MFAVSLGMNVEEIEAAIADGLTLCEIAESRDIDLDMVWESTKNNRAALLQQFLNNGSVTQTQAEWISGRLSGFEPRDACGGKPTYLPLITNE